MKPWLYQGHERLMEIRNFNCAILSRVKSMAQRYTMAKILWNRSFFPNLFFLNQDALITKVFDALEIFFSSKSRVFFLVSFMLLFFSNFVNPYIFDTFFDTLIHPITDICIYCIFLLWNQLQILFYSSQAFKKLFTDFFSQ